MVLTVPLLRSFVVMECHWSFMWLLQSKSSLVDAEKRLDGCMKKVEVLADKVMKTRERLCNGTKGMWFTKATY